MELDTHSEHDIEVEIQQEGTHLGGDEHQNGIGQADPEGTVGRVDESDHLTGRV